MSIRRSYATCRRSSIVAPLRARKATKSRVIYCDYGSVYGHHDTRGVILVDDVVTTGRSMKRAEKAPQTAGWYVEEQVCVLDRREELPEQEG